MAQGVLDAHERSLRRDRPGARLLLEEKVDADGRLQFCYGVGNREPLTVQLPDPFTAQLPER